MRTTGGRVVPGRSGKSVDRIDLARYSRRRSGCCTVVLHAGDVCGTAKTQTHGSGGGKRGAPVPAHIVIKSGSWSTLGPQPGELLTRPRVGGGVRPAGQPP